MGPPFCFLIFLEKIHKPPNNPFSPKGRKVMKSQRIAAVTPPKR